MEKREPGSSRKVRLGQPRRLDPVAMTSDLPRAADILSSRGRVTKVPGTDIASPNRARASSVAGSAASRCPRWILGGRGNLRARIILHEAAYHTLLRAKAGSRAIPLETVKRWRWPQLWRRCFFGFSDAPGVATGALPSC